LVLLHGLAGSMVEWTSFVRELSPSIPIIAFDLRGHGRSTRIPESLEPGEFVLDCKEVLRSLNAEKCVLIGQSMGGIIATLLAADAECQAIGLILVDAGMKEHGDDEDLSSLERWLESQDMDTLVGMTAIRNLNRDGRFSIWQQLRVPASVVIAERSLLSKEEVDLMRECNGAAQFHLVKDSGHDVHLDQPKELARIVMDFLDGRNDL
jgi:pimeloyl-ACP methyl ester carboxylesterase